MPVIELIPQIVAIAKEHDTATATRKIKALFSEHDVQSAKVQTWSDEDFENIKTGHPDNPTGSTPAPMAEATKRPNKDVTFYSKADDEDVNDALKRLGFPEPPEAA